MSAWSCCSPSGGALARGCKEFETGVLRSSLGFLFDSAAPVGVSWWHPRRTTGLACRAARRRRARRRAPGERRSAILAAARAIAKHAPRPDRLAHDGEHRLDLRRQRRERRARTLPDRRRGRSLEAARAEQIASELVECLTDAANDPECECDLDVHSSAEFEGYRVRPSSGEVALRSMPTRLRTQNAGDDERRWQRRKRTARPRPRGAEPDERHRAQSRPGERVSTSALEAVLDVAFALVERAGR